MNTLNDIGDFMVEQIRENIQERKHPQSPENDILLFGWKLQYSQQVSNSHCAPKNGETNWGGKKLGVPKNYPGWSGRVWLVLKNSTNTGIGNYFANCLGYRGSGGYGLYHIKKEFPAAVAQVTKQNVGLYDNYPMGYDFKIFGSDYPEVQAFEQKDFILAEVDRLITNSPSSILPTQPFHKYIYVNPKEIIR